MLKLNDHLLINHGRTRVCHEHPSDNSLVVKTPFSGNEEGYLSNANEFKAYHNLMSQHPMLSCISHCRGYIETNRGKGLLCQSIRDYDGRISKSIYDIVVYQEDCDLEYLKQVTADFCEYLQTHDIFIFDINLKNIVMQVQENGSYIPYIIDFKSQVETKEFIPLSKYSKYFARKKLSRRTQQLIARISEFYARREELKQRDQKEKRKTN